uniref:Uncharacterized protein n=1 Tax=Arundo donax TaxID=35708 RepID=A0A0A9FCW7_ARUDO
MQSEARATKPLGHFSASPSAGGLSACAMASCRSRSTARTLTAGIWRQPRRYW